MVLIHGLSWRPWIHEDQITAEAGVIHSYRPILLFDQSDPTMDKVGVLAGSPRVSSLQLGNAILVCAASKDDKVINIAGRHSRYRDRCGTELRHIDSGWPTGAVASPYANPVSSTHACGVRSISAASSSSCFANARRWHLRALLCTSTPASYEEVGFQETWNYVSVDIVELDLPPQHKCVRGVPSSVSLVSS